MSSAERKDSRFKARRCLEIRIGLGLPGARPSLLLLRILDVGTMLVSASGKSAWADGKTIRPKRKEGRSAEIPHKDV